MIGSLIAAACCLLLIFLFQHGLPAWATERHFGWDRYHERQHACAIRPQKQLACAKCAPI